jgi:hypothetical protein
MEGGARRGIGWQRRALCAPPLSSADRSPHWVGSERGLERVPLTWNQRCIRSSPRKRGPRSRSTMLLDSRLRGNERNPLYANRSLALARAFIASASRSRAGLAVSSDCRSRRAASDTSSTARLNAASLTLDGFVNPLSLRTNCSADARISSSLAGGSKLNSVRIFRHIDPSCRLSARGDIGDPPGCRTSPDVSTLVDGGECRRNRVRCPQLTERFAWEMMPQQIATIYPFGQSTP